MLETVENFGIFSNDDILLAELDWICCLVNVLLFEFAEVYCKYPFYVIDHTC